MSPMPPKNCWSFTRTVNSFETYFGDEVPSVLTLLKERNADLALGAFGMSVAFLEDALIAK
jgi:hypothetical protein